jgi:Tol biopolymer transport system component
VLYEMVAGRRAFEAKTQAGLIARIMEHDPAPASSATAAAPAALDRLMRDCLAKDPAERRQSMHDVLLDLLWIAEGSAAAPAPAAEARSGGRVWMLSTAVLALALLLGAAYATLRPRPDLPVARFAISLPEKSNFGFGLAISPDGKRVAFVAQAAGGRNMLWVRPIDSLEARPLAGTETASLPFWSPDSRFLAFFANGKLSRVDAAGGPVQILCEAPDGRGGTWNQEGVLLFNPDGGATTPLLRVSAAGGTPTPVTRLDTTRGDRNHRWPEFLPDGRHFIFFITSAQPAKYAIAAGSLDSTEGRILTLSDTRAAYAPPGYLLFVRGGALMAQAFDAGKLRLTGEAASVAQDLGTISAPLAYAAFSASRTGILCYRPGALQQGRLFWFDRGGKPLGAAGPPAHLVEPDLSPDGKRVAAEWDDANGNKNLWILDFERDAISRFSFGAPAEDGQATWSPDGTHIAFTSNRNNASGIYQRLASGAGGEELLYSDSVDKNLSLDDWSRDGRRLVFEVVDPKNKQDLWILPLDGSRKAVPYLETPFAENHARISPDGRWLAYASEESGRSEVYVQSFPVPGGGKFQVSAQGGDQATWRGDGKELYYLAPDSKMMAVPVRTDAGFQYEAPRALFQTRAPAPFIGGLRNSYVVAAGGQKFLIYTLDESAGTSQPIVTVLNWMSAFNK